MFIIPGLISEKEIKFFNEETWAALCGVMDEVIANMLTQYMQNNASDSELVSQVLKYCGSTIDSLTFHLQLKDKGILDLVVKITPETLLNNQDDFLESTRKSLTYLEQNEKRIRAIIPKRTDEQWCRFYNAMVKVVNDMYLAGVQTEVPNLLEVLTSNRFLFYTPRETDHVLPSRVVLSRRNKWIMCLRGLEYDAYCKERNIKGSSRWVF